MEEGGPSIAEQNRAKQGQGKIVQSRAAPATEAADSKRALGGGGPRQPSPASARPFPLLPLPRMPPWTDGTAAAGKTKARGKKKGDIDCVGI